MMTVEQKKAALLASGHEIDLPDEEIAQIPDERIQSLTPDISSANTDASKGADLNGRFMAKNFGDEGDPATLRKLQEENPGTTVVQKDGHIFAKTPGDQAWHPLTGDSNPWSDHVAQGGKLAAILGINAATDIPTAGMAAVPAMAITGGAVEGARQGIGRLAGYLSKGDSNRVLTDAGLNALAPGVGVVAGAELPVLGQSLADLAGKGMSRIGQVISGYPAQYAEKFLKPGYRAGIQYLTGQNNIEPIRAAIQGAAEPILAATQDAKTKAGEAIRNVMGANATTFIPTKGTLPGGTYIPGPRAVYDGLKQEFKDRIASGASDQAENNYEIIKQTLKPFLPKKYATIEELFQNEQDLKQLANYEGDLSNVPSTLKKQIQSTARDMAAATKTLRQTAISKLTGKSPEEITALDEAYTHALDNDRIASSNFEAGRTQSDLPKSLSSVADIPENPTLRGVIGSNNQMTPELESMIADTNNARSVLGAGGGARISMSPKLMAARAVFGAKGMAKLNEILGNLGESGSDGLFTKAAKASIMPWMDENNQDRQ